MFKIIIILAALLICTPSFSQERYWIHFQNNVSSTAAENFLKSHKLFVQEQKCHPLRYAVISSRPPLELEQAPEVKEVNQSTTPVIAPQFYSAWGLSEEQKDRYSLYLGIGSFSALTTYGLLSWDWGSKGMGFGSEGWFGKNTYAGGADKIGHATSLYFQKRTLNWMLLQMGHDYDHANIYSTIIAESLGIALEIGDGLSKYLFSFEDLAVDTAGIIFAFLLDKYPSLDALLGLQLMYFPSSEYLDSRNPDKADISSDYNGMEFLLNIKATGIPTLNEHKYARYLMLNLGYRTRGYLPDFTPETLDDNQRTRELTISLGLNLSELVFGIKPQSQIIRASSTLLKYWTPPHSTLPLGKHSL